MSSSTPGILNDAEIVATVKLNPNFILPFDLTAVQPASYDLALGEAYHAVPDATGRSRMWAPLGLKSQKWVSIPPFQSALFESREALEVPNDLVGHIWLDYEWMAKGIVYSGGAIDPTYCGKIWIPVHNVGPKTVEIGYDDKLVSVEWVRLIAPTTASAPYGRKPLLTLQDLPASKIPTPPDRDLRAWNDLSHAVDDLLLAQSEMNTKLKGIETTVTTRLNAVEADKGRNAILIGLLLTVGALALTVSVTVFAGFHL